jgi:hypothetical protein
VCGSFWGLKKFKMAAVAMVTKMQKMLNSLQTSQSLAVKFLAMEIKKGGFRKKNVDFFHQTS